MPRTPRVSGRRRDPVAGDAIADLRPTRQYTIPDALRSTLAEPFGPVYTTQELQVALKSHRGPVLAVGDHVSLTLKELGISPRLFVCDYHTQRGQNVQQYQDALSNWGDNVLQVTNPPATLTREAWNAIRRAVEGKVITRIEVEVEEDLLGIPCFLEAPPGSVVLYGMPGQGVVWVEVNQEVRERVAALVYLFEST